MAAAILTDIALRLRANTAELQSGLARAKGNIKTFKKDTKGATKELGGAFKTLGGEAASGISRMSGGFGAMTSTIGGAIRAVKNLAGGMNVLKVALISTGIGAIFVAIGTAIAGVTAYFRGTIDGAGKLASITGVLKGVFTALQDVLISVGRFLVKMFEDPKQGIADLWAMIKENLINRFVGMVDLFKNGWQAIANGAKGVGMAIAGIFNKEKRDESKKYFDDMKTNLVDVGKAAFKMTTGIDFDKAAEKASAMFEKGKSQAKEIQGLNERRFRLELHQVETMADEARMARDIKILREETADVERGLAARLETSNQALALTDQLYSKKVRDAQSALNIQKELNAASETSLEDLRKEKELEVALLGIEAEKAERVKELKEQRKTILAETQRQADAAKNADLAILAEMQAEDKKVTDSIAAYREKVQQSTLEGQLKFLEDQFKKRIIFEEEYLGEVKRVQEEIAERDKKLADEELERIRTVKEAKISSVNGYMDAALQASETVATMFEAAKAKELAAAEGNEAKKADIEKKYAKKQKGIAKLQAVINAALGITKAFGDGGVLGFITGGLVAAATAAQIKIIDSTPLAKGAIAYSPVNALVGEYPGAARNPEVIAPLDKLTGIISNALGGSFGGGDVRFEIDGYKLVGILSKQMKLNAIG